MFGEEVTNELVDWFNTVDATYRADLRELNELNFARFDAKLEQRLTELDAKWGGQSAALDAKLDQRVAELRTSLAELKSELLRWMFAFWVTTGLALAALFFRK
jgi:uncharacterized coiled-coil protein SlyX